MTSPPENTSATSLAEKYKRPNIGLLPEIEKPTSDWEGTRWVFPKCNYDALNNAGAKPVFLQYDVSKIPDLVKSLDGLLLPGNVFDIADYKNLAESAKERLVFEMKLTTAMFEAGKPVFGICGGLQAVGKLLGGEMLDDIPTAIGTHVSHNHKDYRGIAHDVEITPGSFMHLAAGGKTNIGTNGIHHQGYLKLPEIFKVAAKTSDGVVEAASLHDSKGNPIFYGTQFHPEINNTTGVVRPGSILTETDVMYNNLMRNFVERAKQPPVPELTSGLVATIKSINAVQKVVDAPTKPDWDNSVVMPDANAVKKDEAPKKEMCGASVKVCHVKALEAKQQLSSNSAVLGTS